MKTLMDLDSFGGTAAEDDDIRRFFLRTRAFESLWEGKRSVVVGRKGSGKTALYLALEDRGRREGTGVASLSFSSYPWSAHYRYAHGDVTPAEKFVESWRFLILVEAWALILEPRVNIYEGERSANSVRKFLEDNYGSIHFDFKNAFPTGRFNLKVVEADPSFAGVRLGGMQAKRDGLSLGQTLGRLNDWLWEKMIQVQHSLSSVHVLFDELDLGFDPNDPDYLSRVSGLLVAVRQFGKIAKSRSVPVFPIAFLRSDIFDELHFGDKNKIREANLVELRWHDRLDHSDSSLKHLIDWRIRELLGLENVTSAWEAVFDPQLTRGTQHKFQHISFRTFLRPRDVIKFCNIALSVHQERVRRGDVSEHSLIDNEDLRASRGMYSEYFKLELDDEISEAHPEWQDCLEVLRALGAAKFDISQFHDAYEAASQRVQVRMSHEDVLPFLYRYSIVGFEKTRPTGSGFVHHFRYQDESVNFMPDARSFLVHRGLKEALDLTETAGKRGQDEESYE